MKIGAIIGGTVSGLVVLAAMVTILLYFRRKRAREIAAYLQPTSLQIPAALANDPSTPNPSTVRNKRVAASISPVLPLPGPPVASSSGTSSNGTTLAQPTPVQMRSEAVNVRGSTSNVLLMEWMRTTRAITSHGVQSVDMDLRTAPPSYYGNADS